MDIGKFLRKWQFEILFSMKFEMFINFIVLQKSLFTPRGTKGKPYAYKVTHTFFTYIRKRCTIRKQDGSEFRQNSFPPTIISGCPLQIFTPLFLYHFVLIQTMLYESCTHNIRNFGLKRTQQQQTKSSLSSRSLFYIIDIPSTQYMKNFIVHIFNSIQVPFPIDILLLYSSSYARIRSDLCKERREMCGNVMVKLFSYCVSDAPPIFLLQYIDGGMIGGVEYSSDGLQKGRMRREKQ